VLFDEFLASCVGRVLLAVIVNNVLELLIVTEAEFANDDLDDIGPNGELVCVLVKIKVVVECVGRLDAPIEVVFLVVDRQRLVLDP
jgi:hypothetical protein